MSTSARPARGFILLSVVLALMLVAAVAFLLNRSGGMNMSMAARGLEADRARYVAEAGLAQINVRTQNRNCRDYTDLATTAFGPHSFIATVNPKSGTPVTLTATATTADGATATLTRSGVVVYQNSRTTTLQAGAGGFDSYISKSNTTGNFGSSSLIKMHGDKYYPVLKFDLSSIPAVSRIQAAHLSLYKQAGSPGTGDVATAYRLTKAWIEGTKDGGGQADGVTWGTTDGYAAWTQAGGDFDVASGMSSPIAGSNNTRLSFDVLNLASDWVNLVSPNFGMILSPSVGTTETTFASRTDGTSSQWPNLTLTLWPPCGWTAAPQTLTAVQDSGLSKAGPTFNDGASPSVQLFFAANDKRIVARFDLSGVPAGTLIQSAKLRFYTASMAARSGAAMPVSAYALNRSWVEGTKTGAGAADGVTYNSWDGTNLWVTGGDYRTPAAASLTLPSSFVAPNWFELDITALVQEWVDGVTANNGVIVITTATDKFTISMRDAADNWPQLVLVY